MTRDPLIATALLGTARMQQVPSAPHADLETTWSAIRIDDPADVVLQALALTRAMHRGGTKLRDENESVTALGVVPEPLLSGGAVDTLIRLLNGEFPDILPEWLGIAFTSDRVLPGRVLPELLAAATKDHSLRALTRKLAGERGKWIAARHQTFSWIIDGQIVEENSWEDGSPVERLAWLRQTRQVDPSRALEAVTSHWSGEDAAMRESILKLISENPLPSDEAWLEEHALTDRRQGVRDLAAVSLVCLPDSAFRKRALGRIDSCVKIQRRLLKRTITVEPPGAFDPSWAADGIKEKPPQGTGEKAWWLRQMVAMVPIADWPELLDCRAEELFSLSIDSDWKEVILLGWLDSARRMPSGSLPEHLIRLFATLTPQPTALPAKNVLLAGLFGGMPIALRFSLLDEFANELQPLLVLEILANCRQAPPPGTGNKILSVLDAAIGVHFHTLTRPQGRALAICIPAAGIQQRLEAIAKLPELSSAAEEFATTLEFRRSLISHFKLP